jgi:hypothetical protein
MKRRMSSPDIVALVFLTVALLWFVPALERHADWLPFHTEWSGIRVALERPASSPASLQ